MRRMVAAQIATDQPDSLPSTPALVRVVSIPANHPYVHRVTSAKGIEVLPDPHRAHDPADQWWPPMALDAAWIQEHAGEADLLHIHFGTESFSLDHLRRALAAARDIGWPIVVTVHDIDHPQLGDQTAYRAQLEVLVPAADALITLTIGAAKYITERWGRSAEVIGHPSVFIPPVLPDVLPEATGSTERRVGVFLKDIRPNVDAVGIVLALNVAVGMLADDGTNVVGEVHMHHRVRDELSQEWVRALAAASDRIVLIEHDRLDDRQLAVALARLDACVLPYRHGTHSGWLELCWDLAVAVAAPAVGFFAEQHVGPSIASFQFAQPSDESSSESDAEFCAGPRDELAVLTRAVSHDEVGASLSAALATVLDGPASTRAGSPERTWERARRYAQRLVTDEAAAVRHAELYRRLVAERRS